MSENRFGAHVVLPPGYRITGWKPVSHCLCGDELDENGRCPRQEREYAEALNCLSASVSYLWEPWNG